VTPLYSSSSISGEGMLERPKRLDGPARDGLTSIA
jgi:hypothetical protein